MCQHWVLPVMKALTYGFHPRQDRCSLGKHYETRTYLMENTDIHTGFCPS